MSNFSLVWVWVSLRLAEPIHAYWLSSTNSIVCRLRLPTSGFEVRRAEPAQACWLPRRRSIAVISAVAHCREAHKYKCISAAYERSLFTVSRPSYWSRDLNLPFVLIISNNSTRKPALHYNNGFLILYYNIYIIYFGLR